MGNRLGWSGRVLILRSMRPRSTSAKRESSRRPQSRRCGSPAGDAGGTSTEGYCVEESARRGRRRCGVRAWDQSRDGDVAAGTRRGARCRDCAGDRARARIANRPTAPRRSDRRGDAAQQAQGSKALELSHDGASARVNKATVNRIWISHGLKPHLSDVQAVARHAVPGEAESGVPAFPTSPPRDDCPRRIRLVTSPSQLGPSPSGRPLASLRQLLLTLT
jgi:hypothetical protein